MKPRSPKPRKASLVDREYPTVKAGQWVYPLEDYRMMCCDCGLVHRIQFQQTKDGGVRLRAWRDSRETARMRRLKLAEQGN